MKVELRHLFSVCPSLDRGNVCPASPKDSFTRGIKCKLLCLKEHAELQYHRATSAFSKYVPLPPSLILNIPYSRRISELCEDDSDTESETDDSDIEL